MKKSWMMVGSCLICVVIFCIMYVLLRPGITLEAATSVEYSPVDKFYLSLKLRDEADTIQEDAIYGSSEWDSNGGITDVLTCIEDDETYYLIPVSYFTEHYASYGYTFDEGNTAVCPFVYAPDARYNTRDLTPARYVYVPSNATDGGTPGWYVRVQDTGSYENSPCSNVYYAQEDADIHNFFTLTYGSATITFFVVDGSGNAIAGDYSSYSITATDSTKYVFGLGNKAEQNGSEVGAVEEMALPSIDGYIYSGATLEDDAASIASVATTGYVNSKGNRVGSTFQFYEAEPMIENNWYSGYGSYKIELIYGITVDTISPSGTVINLFDYWVTSQLEDDISNGYSSSGINSGHALKFTPTPFGKKLIDVKYGETASANAWTGSEAVYPGIVNNVLTKGYPTLTTKAIFADSRGVLASGNNESLDYLFDPDYTGESSAYRKSYRNVTGLLQEDSSGYFCYDSEKNYAQFDEVSNGFKVYNTSAINGQFFPFDKYAYATKTSTHEDKNLNHYFGMTLTSRFIQQYAGYTDSTKTTPMEFQFSGDDDVWIFIDNVLVADLGGNHSAAKVSINFANGTVTINDTKKETSNIKQAFIDAGRTTSEDTDGWNGNTFADGTYHTLKFYYLERGSHASNLYLKYNLHSYPPTSIYKVDQYGGAVRDAAFAIYAATPDSDGTYLYKTTGGGTITAAQLADCTLVTAENYSSFAEKIKGVAIGDYVAKEQNSIIVQALYTGITDKKGEMEFLDEDGMPYTLSELQGMFGDYFVLKEIKLPEGYRLVSDAINLNIYDNKILMCTNTYTSGVYADASILVTAPNTLQMMNSDDTVVYFNGTSTIGTLFAVVLKYIGPDVGEASNENLTDQTNWAPVYGTVEEGFTVVDVEKQFEGDFIAAALDTAKKYKESQNVFEMSSGGQMQARINGTPGDITTYYYMLDAESKSKTQYTVAYYYSTASNLKTSVRDNTCRINADSTSHAFTRSFGATIHVPNLRNRLVTQKLDKQGKLVNGATFALYSVEETENTVYYTGYTDDEHKEKTLIRLGPDNGTQEDDENDGNNMGKARLSTDTTWTGFYEIITKATGSNRVGDIIVTIGSGHTQTTYTIKAVDTAITVPKTDEANIIGEDGSASFTDMDDGYYYLREIIPPSGYTLNTTEVMVLVDDTAVYANAGTEIDGVTVSRGPGYIVYTMDRFASHGEIDNTLSWVYEQMLVSGKSTSFEDVYKDLDNRSDWKYLHSYTGTGESAVTTTTENQDEAFTTYLTYNTMGDENKLYNYTVNEGRYQDGETTGVSRRLYTSVGWSYYLLYQDYEYGSKYLRQQGSSANYTNLQGKEISNLFSRSTFVQVTDKKVQYNLDIIKISSSVNKDINDETTELDSTKLSGATFTLYSDEACTEKVQDITADATTTEGGVASFEGLSEGTYYLKETQAPASYRLNGTVYKITIWHENQQADITVEQLTDTLGNELEIPIKLSNDGTFDVDDYHTDKLDISTPTTSRYQITFKVADDCIYELPQTGGMGTYGFTIFGAAILMTMLLLSLKDKKGQKGGYLE